MSEPPQFVVIDFHAESRYLLVKTLRRKFPEAVVHETDDAEKAIEIIRAGQLAAIITHRTFEIEGVALVQLLRAEAPNLPIIMVSGMDREVAALRAGASRFLPYDEWLRIGSLVDELLSAHSRPDGAATRPDLAV